MAKKTKKKTPKGTMFSFPQRKETEEISKDDAIQLLAASNVNISPNLLQLLRLPRHLIRGMIESFEFFDFMSAQPFPSKSEDSPSFCFDRDLSPPAWIKQSYLSITEEKNGKYLTFIDVPRGIFIKKELSKQDEIASHIYEKMMKAGAQ